MRLHPLLSEPNAVLISRTPVSDPVTWEDFRQAARQAMAAMQIELQGEKAVIKPNLTSAEHFADPDTGITTHPFFVQGIAEHLNQNGVKRRGVYVLEDPRNSNDNEPRHWRGTGFCEMAAATGAKLRCPKTYSCVKKRIPRPQVFAELNVSRLAVAPNTVLFNVPKLKTHNLGITTLCMKNLMGAVNVFDRHYCGQSWRDMPEQIRDDQRPRTEWLTREIHEQWQERLGRRLADTAQAIGPGINMVEGVVGREGTGFQRGRNRSLGLVVAGTNIVAVDSVASYLMGLDPRELVYLRVAAEVGLGVNDVNRLNVYKVEEGIVVPCTDLEAERARPPFRVVSGIMGEEEGLFCES